ncbi:MAG: hypothetical protein PHQ23_05870, partial [Candidatus Wallbacteria bacterium]|nr:hypothetical protein [Candidatus Wallbacteria bacterium]
MIKCPGCNKFYSDKTEKCQNCGTIFIKRAADQQPVTPAEEKTHQTETKFRNTNDDAGTVGEQEGTAGSEAAEKAVAAAEEAIREGKEAIIQGASLDGFSIDRIKDYFLQAWGLFRSDPVTQVLPVLAFAIAAIVLGFVSKFIPVIGMLIPAFFYLTGSTLLSGAYL